MEFNEHYPTLYEEDIKPQIISPKVDPFRILLFDKDYKLILHYCSPTFHGKDLDFIPFLQSCELIEDKESTSSEFPNIKIVLSLKIQNFLLDIASAKGIYCICLAVDDINCRYTKINSLNSICTLFSLFQMQPEFEFQQIRFHNMVMSNLYQSFSCLCDPSFSEFVAVVSSFNEVFFTFGEMKNLSKEDYYEIWDEAMAIANNLQMSDQNVLSDTTDFLAVFSFLPNVKIFVLFSEEALKFPEPEDPKERIAKNNEMLMFPFIEKMKALKENIPQLYQIGEEPQFEMNESSALPDNEDNQPQEQVGENHRMETKKTILFGNSDPFEDFKF